MSQPLGQRAADRKSRSRRWRFQVNGARCGRRRTRHLRPVRLVAAHRWCPQHSDFDDDRIRYALARCPRGYWPASYWVNDTFAAAAREAGLDDSAALVEGIEEFAAALKRGDLKPTRSR